LVAATIQQLLHAQEKITSLVQEDSVLQIVIKELEEKIRQQ